MIQREVDFKPYKCGFMAICLSVVCCYIKPHQMHSNHHLFFFRELANNSNKQVLWSIFSFVKQTLTFTSLTPLELLAHCGAWQIKVWYHQGPLVRWGIVCFVYPVCMMGVPAVTQVMTYIMFMLNVVNVGFVPLVPRCMSTGLPVGILVLPEIFGSGG